jgi:hypothetical protein
MTRFRILAFLILAAGATGFAFRCHSLRELRAEHQQLQEALHSQPATESAITLMNRSVSGDLSAAEHSELLRLRGQLGLIRRELSGLTNQLTRRMTNDE